MRTVEIMTEVEVDLDDYVDEILEECDDDELIKEVEKRGHRVYFIEKRFVTRIISNTCYITQESS